MPSTTPILSDEEALQKQPVEYVVLSGGGAKGVLYSGVHKALSDSGTLLNVKGIAGSSAGAISAAFIATGMSPEDFKKTTDEQNFGDLLGKGKIPIKSIPLQKDGMPLYELLDKQIRKNIGDFVRDNDIGKLAHERLKIIAKEHEESDINLAERKSSLQYAYSEIDSLIKLKVKFKEKEDLAEINSKIKLLIGTASELEITLTALSDKIKALSKGAASLKEIEQNPELAKQKLLDKCRPGGKICFKDLATMHLLAPQKFKDLHVTAVQQSNGELKIFNAVSSPDVEIALACRASASIPIVFQSVEIDGIKYVDGGFRDNTPYQAFDKKHTKNSPQTQSDVEDITNDQAKIAEAYRMRKTLAFVFSDDSSKEALYSSKKTIGDNPTKIRKFITGIMNAISRNKQKDISKDNPQSEDVTESRRPKNLKEKVLRKLTRSQEKHQHLRGEDENVQIRFRDKIIAKIIEKLSGVGGIYSYATTLEHEYSNMRANSRNTVALDPKAVGTMSFKQAQKDLDRMYSTGYINTMEHLSTFREHTTKQDPNLSLQSIMLQVYDDVEKTRPTKIWQHKIHGTSARQKDLLEFSTPQKWKGRKTDDVVKEYIESIIIGSSKKPGQKEFSANTPAAQSMIHVLNAKTTPDAVKEKFAQVLGKTSTSKPFDKKDLESFISKNKEYLASKAPTVSQKHR